MSSATATSSSATNTVELDVAATMKRKCDGADTDTLPVELCGVDADVEIEMDTSPICPDIHPSECYCAWSIESCNMYFGSHPLLNCGEEGCNERIHLKCQSLWENSREVIDGTSNDNEGVYCPTHHPYYMDKMIEMFDGHAQTSCVPLLPPFQTSFPSVEQPAAKRNKKSGMKPGPSTKYTQWGKRCWSWKSTPAAASATDTEAIAGTAADPGCDVVSSTTSGATSKVTNKKKKKDVNHAALLQSFQTMCCCKLPEDLLNDVLLVSAAMESLEDSNERGSGSTDPDRKAKSLRARWFGEAEKATADDAHLVPNCEFYVKRDVILSCDVVTGSGKNAQRSPMTYRVIGLYDKMYNKWYLTGEKKPWGQSMSNTEKKKYKLAARMVEGCDIFGKYEYVSLHDERYKLNNICRVIDGAMVTCVKGKYQYNATA